MLVNRYFGSKEGLFAEAVEVAFAERTLLGDDDTILGQDVADALVAMTAPDSERIAPFLLVLRSSSNPRAAAILRDSIESRTGPYRGRCPAVLGRDVRRCGHDRRDRRHGAHGTAGGSAAWRATTSF